MFNWLRLTHKGRGGGKCINVSRWHAVELGSDIAACGFELRPIRGFSRFSTLVIPFDPLFHSPMSHSTTCQRCKDRIAANARFNKYKEGQAKMINTQLKKIDAIKALREFTLNTFGAEATLTKAKDFVEALEAPDITLIMPTRLFLDLRRHLDGHGAYDWSGKLNELLKAPDGTPLSDWRGE